MLALSAGGISKGWWTVVKSVHTGDNMNVELTEDQICLNYGGDEPDWMDVALDADDIGTLNRISVTIDGESYRLGTFVRKYREMKIDSEERLPTVRDHRDYYQKTSAELRAKVQRLEIDLQAEKDRKTDLGYESRLVAKQNTIDANSDYYQREFESWRREKQDLEAVIDNLRTNANTDTWKARAWKAEQELAVQQSKLREAEATITYRAAFQERLLKDNDELLDKVKRLQEHRKNDALRDEERKEEVRTLQAKLRGREQDTIDKEALLVVNEEQRKKLENLRRAIHGV
jgi:chromosome segregation ATPase